MKVETLSAFSSWRYIVALSWKHGFVILFAAVAPPKASAVNKNVLLVNLL